MRKILLVVLLVPAGCSIRTQDVNAGGQLYQERCASCHGVNGFGAEHAGAIDATVAFYDDRQLVELIRKGMPERGKSPIELNDADAARLVRFLRTLQDRAKQPLSKIRVTMAKGDTLEGEVLNRGALDSESRDLQLRTRDGRVHLLRRHDDRYREVTSDHDWPGYNGGPSGNRYTELKQIAKENVARLRPAWTFTVPGAQSLEVTPVVVDGVMYVAERNECFALDAGTGRQLWHYRRPQIREVTFAPNRGAAVAGDRIFMVTDHAHLIALHRATGALLWESEIADYRQNYFATSAPLVAGGLVVSGVAGGEQGASGFIAAFDAETGREVWRFHTIPRPGEPGSETWTGNSWEHGGAPTWFTGSYDPELDTVFWPTGNPGPDYNGHARQGDNLYSDSVLALDVKTGKLKWYFQFTPHDVWDWDATETLVLVDAAWRGKPRKLLLQANRNGFFYVFDRTSGELLLARSFTSKLTWASGIRPNGRPILNPKQEPTESGARVCPTQSGATNWYSPSFDPASALLYVQTLENCGVYKENETRSWSAGESYLGGAAQNGPNGSRVLKAIDIQTGLVSWQLPQPGPGQSWGGTLATATGLVFFGSESGELMAVAGATGKPLWRYQTNRVWRASPMTYAFDGTQFIAVAAGPDIRAFALPQH